MSVGGSSAQKKPDNIIWIEEVLLNNLEENGGIASLNTDNNERTRGENDSPSKKLLKSESGSDLKETLDSNSTQSVRQPERELKIGIAEIELKDENYLGDERIHTLSRIVTGKIKYYIENKDNEEERYQYWLIKMPNLNNPQRELAQMIDASKREIAFYTEILPEIKSWLESNNFEHPVDFHVPTCFYGKYLRPVDRDPDLDIITHILDSESLLVLDDLRASGFGKRHFGSGLLISEAFAAIEEIATFHVTTWAMQQIENKKLSWGQLYDPISVAKLYHKLLENNFNTLQNFLARDSKHPRAREILARLQKVRPHLYQKISALLTPAQDGFPNTLLHLDLWSENLLFRMTDQDKDDEVPLEEADLDCYILDWQMVSYGKPTHDLALLLELSMDPQYRRQHLTLILQYYYLLFKQYASNFGLEVQFEFEKLVEEYNRSTCLATLMAMASIEIVLLEESTQNRLMEALTELLEGNVL